MFDIFLNNTVVGKAQVEKEGMFYKMTCTCTITDDRMHRISVNDGETSRDLGICIPSGDVFTLTARLPVKQLKGDTWSFVINTQTEQSRMVPVATGEPFEYLDKLDSARLQITNGQTEIIIDSIQDQPDSDQSQELQNKWVLL